MKLIRPITVDPTALVSSSVSESEPIWSAAATYASGAIVRGNAPHTTHRLFESLQAANTGHALTDGAWWLEAGPTNRWRMFDQAVQTQTQNADQIAVEVAVPTRIDSLALLNVDGVSVDVVMTDPIEGVVYDQTFSLVSTDGIVDWHSYFFEPIERRTDLVVMNLPPYANVELGVTINAPADMARVGAMVVGLSRQIGEASYGARVGITDYSRKATDDFGNFVVVERAFSKRASFTVTMDSGLTDQVQNLLARFRAHPLVYVGSERFGSTIVYGYYRDFNVEIAGPNHSVCSLELEGLA
ncbi:hypothetical protein D3C86_878740 [compost metagenome]